MQEIFHYTSVSAFKKILETSTLWATRTSHLNDSSEMHVIWPRIEPLVIDFYKNELCTFNQQNPDLHEAIGGEGGIAYIANSDGLKMAKELRSGLRGYDALPSLQERFVVSFTTHNRDPDLDAYLREHGMLSQWRGYGRDAGVAIVFDRQGIQELRQTEHEPFHYWQNSLWDVTYDKKDMDLREDFRTLVGALQNFVRVWIHRNHDTVALERQLNSVYRELLLAVTRFKHIAFYEEQECRIVMGVILESCLAKFASGGKCEAKSFKKVHHRKGSCGSIPYIRLFEDSGHNLPIKRIIVGPSRSQDAHLETVQKLARNRGIVVQRSETPFVESV